jgi:hypothetical protein
MQARRSLSAVQFPSDALPELFKSLDDGVATSVTAFALARTRATMMYRVRRWAIGFAFYYMGAVSIARCEDAIVAAINKQRTFERDTAGTQAQRRCMLSMTTYQAASPRLRRDSTW